MPLTQQQQEGVDFMLVNNNRCIVADVAGAGKTYMILSAILAQTGTLPVLVIVIKPGLGVWKREIKKWFNRDSLIYSGTPEKRKELRNEIVQERAPSFIITTFPNLKELIDVFGTKFFQTIVFDEYHMYHMLSRKTAIYKYAHSICRAVPHLIMVTGTPMRKNPGQYFPALSLVDPWTFTSFWKYANEYCIVIRNDFGYALERLPRNRLKLAQLLSKYMIRREADDLPERLRIAVPVEMTKGQKKLYEQLQKEMWMEFGDHFIATPNNMTKVMRTRQILVTPKIFGMDIESGALNALVELTQKEILADNPVAIFTPFVEAIPFIAEKLSDTIKDLTIYQVIGGKSSDYYTKIEDDFQGNPTKNKVLICSIKSGASMTFTDAKVAIFIGYEWDSIDNSQAESRSHRKGQTQDVRCLYLLYEGTPDEHIMDILNDKQLAINICLTPSQYYSIMVDKILK